MTDEQLAYEMAKGIGETHVEGFYDSVSCSTAGDYPSIGVSQWEGLGGRGDALLSMIDGGSQFAGRSYTDIRDNEGIDALKAVLGSQSGQEAQNRLIAEDCLALYVPAVKEALTDERCMIYAGMWCPTSHAVVNRFLLRRVERGYDLNSLEILRDTFFNEYTDAAGVGEENREGYQNRAVTTYNYVAALPVGVA